jgi:WD40 repeat protein
VIASDIGGTTRLFRFDTGAQVGAPLTNGSMPASELGTEPLLHGNGSVFRPGSHVALIIDWTTGVIRLVDVDSRTEVSHFTAFSGFSLWNISPDGRLASGGGANATRLYDLQTGTQVGVPFQSASAVTWGTFSPDGRSLDTWDFRISGGTSTPRRGGRRPAPSPDGT